VQCIGPGGLHLTSSSALVIFCTPLAPPRQTPVVVDPYSVSGASEPRLERLVEHLAQSRMRVHHHREILERRARLNGIRALLDQVGSVQPDDVHRDHLVRVRC